MNRIDRLTAILVQLQTKRVVKAEEIADRFEISLRTVYRDVKALMEAGVPIGSEAGKGYFIVDGYHLPPVMFTETEASAMLVGSKLVEKMGDKSVRTAFESAMHKIRAVLNESEKDHLQNLETHIEIFTRSKYEGEKKDFPDHFLTDIQRAVARKETVRIEYSNAEEEQTLREVEPIGIFYYSLSWHLIGWCRLRNSYRDFRADRIKSLVNTGQQFEGRNLITLQEYFKSMFQSNKDLQRVVVTFEKSCLRGRPIYGSISVTDLGDRVRAEFLIDNLNQMSRWLLMYGTSCEIEEPESLKVMMTELVEEMMSHYSRLIPQ